MGELPGQCTNIWGFAGIPCEFSKILVFVPSDNPRYPQIRNEGSNKKATSIFSRTTRRDIYPPLRGIPEASGGLWTRPALVGFGGWVGPENRWFQHQCFILSYRGSWNGIPCFYFPEIPSKAQNIFWTSMNEYFGQKANQDAVLGLLNVTPQIYPPFFPSPSETLQWCASESLWKVLPA